MTVAYRDLPLGIDPIDFLFGDEKITVPPSRFSPELTVRFFERAMQMVDMRSLHAMSDENPFGLVSLPKLLRYEAGYHGKQWLRLNADKALIASTLPHKTPYQLLFFPVYQFTTPEWKDLPVTEVKLDERWLWGRKVFGDISSDALLFGKNECLYFATATWSPEHNYTAGASEPSYVNPDDIPYTFNLSQLKIEQVQWNDRRILTKIAVGQWGDIRSFRSKVELLLDGTAEILESRARHMRSMSRKLDEMIIYSGS